MIDFIVIVSLLSKMWNFELIKFDTFLKFSLNPW